MRIFTRMWPNNLLGNSSSQSHHQELFRPKEEAWAFVGCLSSDKVHAFDNIYCGRKYGSVYGFNQNPVALPKPMLNKCRLFYLPFSLCRKRLNALKLCKDGITPVTVFCSLSPIWNYPRKDISADLVLWIYQAILAAGYIISCGKHTGALTLLRLREITRIFWLAGEQSKGAVWTSKFYEKSWCLWIKSIFQIKI